MLVDEFEEKGERGLVTWIALYIERAGKLLREACLAPGSSKLFYCVPLAGIASMFSRSHLDISLFCSTTHR